MRSDQMPRPFRHADVLEPCPFCGCGQDNFGEYPFPAERADGEWIARCGNVELCGAEIRLGSRDAVIAAWNRRMPDNAAVNPRREAASD